jgi:putative IMPACT (imprinted ancient) family translation regulator
MDHYTLHFSYQDMPAVMKLLKELEMEKLNATFENDCTIEFLMRMDNQKRLETFIEELSSGKLVHLGRA